MLSEDLTTEKIAVLESGTSPFLGEAFEDLREDLTQAGVGDSQPVISTWWFRGRRFSFTP